MQFATGIAIGNTKQGSKDIYTYTLLHNSWNFYTAKYFLTSLSLTFITVHLQRNYAINGATINQPASASVSVLHALLQLHYCNTAILVHNLFNEPQIFRFYLRLYHVAKYTYTRTYMERYFYCNANKLKTQLIFI